ncbi:MAG: hypothetical protein ACK6A5_05705, partial [Flavobacteriales bacterium]
PTALVQRKHHFAIVDEVDSVLVDDARTPLIISGPTPKGEIHQFDEYTPRVERQLRGRAGRQGDPGSSQFYVSLEDDLMRLFNSERIAKIMDTMGLKEGEVIQHSMVTRSIERAQKKVEENNFGIRKRLLEYDD